MSFFKACPSGCAGRDDGHAEAADLAMAWQAGVVALEFLAVACQVFPQRVCQPHGRRLSDRPSGRGSDATIVEAGCSASFLMRMMDDKVTAAMLIGP